MDAQVEPVGVGDALSVPVGLSVEPVTSNADAGAEGSLALADALAESEGVADPEQGAGEAVESASPEVAGITRRAPMATVPVATAPTTEAADRPFRACLGTVESPNRCRASVHSDHAPQRAHRPTVTNPASPGHPREAL